MCPNSKGVDRAEIGLRWQTKKATAKEAVRVGFRQLPNLDRWSPALGGSYAVNNFHVMFIYV